MSSYLFPIETAAVTFPFLALFISLPFLIYHYRKFGRLGKFRSLVLYSFVFYLLCAYYLVVLPLPSIDSVAQMMGKTYELHLFKSLQDFLSQTVFRWNEPHTYLLAMKQSVFLEPLFNVLLLFPFGVYGRYYFRFSLKKTVLVSFFLSLFFELTQLSGLYFIYPRPYRLFDVNDLLHNTLGGGFGYLCAPMFTFFLPTRAALDSESFEKGKTVTLLRRMVAMMIDWFCIDVFTGVLAVFVPTVRVEGSGGNILLFFVQVMVYFVLLNYLWHGQTIGKKVVKIQVMEVDRVRVSWQALAKRYSFFYLLYFVALHVFQFMITHLTTDNQALFVVYCLLALISFGILLLFIFNLLYALVRRIHRLFHETASHTYTISTVKEKEGTHANI